MGNNISPEAIDFTSLTNSEIVYPEEKYHMLSLVMLRSTMNVYVY